LILSTRRVYPYRSTMMILFTFPGGTNSPIRIKINRFRQVVVENFRSMIAQGCLKLVIPGDPMLLRPLESILKTYVGDKVTIFTSKPYFLEILPPDTGKGEALAFVVHKLGIPRESVVAVGDSMNDESMIRWAGVGVAMRNGDERIKAIANLVTDRTNEDDGVADMIERFILGPEEFPPRHGPRGIQCGMIFPSAPTIRPRWFWS